MKKFICLFTILSFFSCYESKEPIQASIKHIIITNDLENQSITFVVSLQNNSRKNVVLFSNSISQNHDYLNAGFFLLTKDFKTSIGGLIPDDNLIHIKANSSSKFLFTYSNRLLNKWKKISYNRIKGELTDIANNCELVYSIEAEGTFTKEFLSKEGVYQQTFRVKKENPKIEFVKEFKIEEALDLVNGKIIDN